MPHWKKRKGGQCEEWGDDTPAFPVSNPAIKHNEEHVHFTGQTSSTSQVQLGPSPTKPRPMVKRRQSSFYHSEDYEYSDFNELPLDGFNADESSDQKLEFSSGSDEDDVDMDGFGEWQPGLYQARDDLTKEAIPNIDPSPYDVLWDADETAERSNGDGSSGKRQRKEAVVCHLKFYVICRHSWLL